MYIFVLYVEVYYVHRTKMNLWIHKHICTNVLYLHIA